MIKIKPMKLSIVGLFAIVIMVFASCSKNESKIGEGSGDAELIAAIQKASNKQNISISELPAPSRTVLNEDYSDDYVDVATLAPELGYEVDMRCEKGPRVGEHRQAYFDLRGRELRADHGGKGDHGDKGDKGDKERICFDLIYPVTFIMQDGTEFDIESKDDEEGWREIKAWYESHPDYYAKPELQFPVDIKYKDGTIVTINNAEEMREAREDCKDDEGDED